MSPLNVISAWLTQLKPDGLLFIDELDRIDTDLEVFKKYLSIAKGIVGSMGASLYIGEVLARSKHKDGLLSPPLIAGQYIFWS